MLIDTHAHIQFGAYDENRDAVIERALEAGIGYIICPGIDLESSEQAVQLAEEYECVYAAAGIHPHESTELPDDWLYRIEDLCDHPLVVALGEIGLDYFKEYSPGEAQRNTFRSQLELAGDLALPIIVHNRDSDEDMRRIITEAGPGNGVMHCFTSDIRMARDMVDLGYLISFTGIATFGNTVVDNTILELPIDHMMVETDSPFLAPAPYRGKTNEPAYVTAVADKIAELKELDPATVRERTTENAQQLFNLPL